MPHFIRKMFYPTGVSPLPWKMLCVLVMLCILNDMNVTMLFSFAPKMIKEFGIPEVDTGYYAGWLSSSMYTGILCCSFVWSYVGDIKGKKLSIIVTTIGHGYATLAFGFSRNYYWAVVTRLLQGCSFGVIPISKSILYFELDDSNMAYGMTVLTSSGVLGYIIGPSFAGFLVFPAEKYPKVFLKEFPILLPHFIVFLLLCIGSILSVIYLPDGKKYVLLYTDDDKVGKEGEAIKHPTDEEQNMDQCIINRGSNRSEDCKCNETVQATNILNKILKNNTIKVITVKDCFISCILYGIYGFASIASNEIFPLLASTSIEYNGMGFTTAEIGTVLLLASVILIVVQIPILRKVTCLLGARKTFICSAMLQALLTALIPSIGRIRNKTALLPILCTHMFILRLCVSGSFLSVTMFINNSISPDLNATANGLGFTLSALGRLISPSIFGALYSWSLTNVQGVNGNKHALGYPFDQYFSFYLLTIVLIFIGFIGTQLSQSVDKRFPKL